MPASARRFALVAASVLALMFAPGFAAAADEEEPGGVVAPAGPVGDWSQFQGDAAHTADAPGGPPPPYEPAWEFPVDGPSGPSSPVIHEGVVYAVGPESVFAVDPATGEQKWSVPRTPGSANPVPAIASVGGEDMLVFLQGSGQETSLAMVNLHDHERAVQLPVIEQDASRGVTVFSDTAYVGDVRGTVHAVDLTERETLWTYDVGESPVILPPPADVGSLYVNGADQRGIQHLAALDATTGEQRWKVPIGPLGLTTSGLSLSDGTIYAAFADGSVRAYAAEDGNLRWSSRVLRPAPSPFLPVSPFMAPAVSGGMVFIGGGSGGVYALDASTGELVWDYQFSGGPAGFILRSAPVVASTSVLIGLQDGRLGAVDTVEGTGIFEVAVDADPSGRRPLKGIAVSDELIVASRGGGGGGLVAYRPDPEGNLTATASPTRFRLGPTLASYALALLLVAGVAFAIAWIVRALIARRSPPPDPMEDAGDDLAGEVG
ncbi:MAG: PQQ-binding-like beta-propeller repeat protein [Actinomycetota bacterium]